MSFVNIVLNAAAVQLLQEMPKVRVRVRGNIVQFRPTSRQNEVNLPKGERLRPINRTSRVTQFSIKEDILEANQTVILAVDKYGWINIIYGTPQNRTSPSARLTPATSEQSAATTKTTAKA